MKCNICGREIPTYTVGDFFPWQCTGHCTPIIPTPPVSIPTWYEPKEYCSHCMCKRCDSNGTEVKDGDHKKCCMCGYRKLV